MLIIDIACKSRPEELLKALERIHNTKKINMEINLYSDTFKLFSHCYKERVDMVIFVDQINPRVDDFDMAYHLKALNEHIMPVIIGGELPGGGIDKRSGHAELFEYIPLEAVQFVLPDVILYANRRVGEKENICLSYRWKNEEYEVDLDRILYFYSEHRIIKYVDAGGMQGVFYQKLDVVEDALRETGAFIRVSKSFLVNKRYILSTTSKEVVMMNNTHISVTRAYRANIKDI